MLKTIVTLIAAVATLAAAAIAPADHIEVLRATPIGMVVFVFVKYAAVIYTGYFVLNIISALLGQGDAGRSPALYWIDYVSSWIAWLSLNLVGLWVLLGCLQIVQGFAPVTKLADMTNAHWVLLGLVIFSWIDVGILQGHKHEAAWQYIQTQRTIAPPPAVAPTAAVVPPAAVAAVAPVAVPIAAPTHVGKFALTILLLIAIAVIIAMVVSSNRERHASNEKADCTVTVTASVVKAGVRFDTIEPNCD